MKNLQGTHDDGVVQDGNEELEQDNTGNSTTSTSEDVHDSIILGGVFGSMGVLGVAAGAVILVKKMIRRPQAAQVEVSLSETEFLDLNLHPNFSILTGFRI